MTTQNSTNPGLAPHGELSSFTSIRLIAGREISTRLRSKAFNILTIVMLVLIGGAVIATKLVGELGVAQTKVGIVHGTQQQLAVLEATGSAIGEELTASTVASEDAGRALVSDGSLDALVVISETGNITAVVDSQLSPRLNNTLALMARNLALDEQITELGGDPAAVNATVSGAAVTVDAINPPHDYDVASLVVGSVAGILIFISLQFGGQYVAQGVVEEKSSRVVELLLSTVRPWELMSGKVIGIGLLGLMQVLLYGVVGLGLALGLGVLSLSLSAAVGTVLWLLVWYLIGFIIYSFGFAGAAALVSRQEDVGGVVMPVLMVVIIAYVAGISVLPSDPANQVVEVMSIIPLFSPILMPMRLAMGGVPGWEAALALVLALAMIPAMAALAGRIYRGAVMQIGARVSLRKAFAADR